MAGVAHVYLLVRTAVAKRKDMKGTKNKLPVNEVHGNCHHLTDG